MVRRWQALGYKVALLTNPPLNARGLGADRVVEQEQWRGFPVAANLLCHEVPGDIVVVVGDDVLPDPDFSAQVLGHAFLEAFPDSFGVMQPTGDRYGCWDIAAVSPWIGRRFIEEAYGGGGPFWPGYYHYWSDCELQTAATRLNVFIQHPEINQYHDHWERKKGQKRPVYLEEAKAQHDKDKALYHRRARADFPGLRVRQGNPMEQKEAWLTWFREKQAQGYESLSGLGSSIVNTKELRDALPGIFTRHKIHSIVDIPCGDWNWMRLVDLSGKDYLGLDIVPDLIEANKAKYQKEGVRFEVRDAVKDALPKADLVICRDFLFHLPNAMAIQVLQNIKESGSRYLLTTSFPRLENNKDLVVGGSVGWRAINVCLPPFNLPPPIESVQENDSNACRSRIVGLFDLTG
jgi:2-polyprenyl-3-methyl-5-hydroxy-6-metoxy-1,4-benzoquinol methylase